jgi:hypothetical protein
LPGWGGWPVHPSTNQKSLDWRESISGSIPEPLTSFYPTSTHHTLCSSLKMLFIFVTSSRRHEGFLYRFPDPSVLFSHEQTSTHHSIKIFQDCIVAVMWGTCAWNFVICWLYANQKDKARHRKRSTKMSWEFCKRWSFRQASQQRGWLKKPSKFQPRTTQSRNWRSNYLIFPFSSKLQGPANRDDAFHIVKITCTVPLPLKDHLPQQNPSFKHSAREQS